MRPWERGCPPFLWFVRRAATSTYLRSVGRRGFNLEGWGGTAVAGFTRLGCAITLAHPCGAAGGAVASRRYAQRWVGRWSIFVWRVRPSAHGVAGIPARRRVGRLPLGDTPNDGRSVVGFWLAGAPFCARCGGHSRAAALSRRSTPLSRKEGGVHSCGAAGSAAAAELSSVWGGLCGGACALSTAGRVVEFAPAGAVRRVGFHAAASSFAGAGENNNKKSRLNACSCSDF